jgi:arylsulfatase A-like enzyme/Flp pilus assembly protein TadD
MTWLRFLRVPEIVCKTLLWPLVLTPLGRPAQAEPAAAQPVILISIDTLRADHLSCYGYTRLRTPHIDSLAEGGTIFTAISSQAPITLPSHVSLFTSTYPFANGIRENAEVLNPGAVTLATVLAAQGYKTAAFIGGYFLDRRYGLEQGFQTYDSPFGAHAVKRALDLKRPAAQVLTAAQQWLEQNSGGPFFLFVHLFDLHQPYDAPAAYHARAPSSEYDQELAYVDDSLGSFIEFLGRSGLHRRALLVLFSDHGESLGEHGENTHGYFIYRSTLHVPLIFRWPTGRRNSKFETRNSGGAAGSPVSYSDDYLKHVDAPGGLIDVAPTILGFLGIAPPETFCGRSLLALAQGDSSSDREVYSESFYAHDKFGWSPLRSLRRGDYQFIDAPHPELYDLQRDPAEVHNLLPSQTALAASYRERLAALVATYRMASAAKPTSTSIAPPDAENLRSLGYLEITSRAAQLDDSGVDPKDRLFEYKRYLLAGHLARTGKGDEAAAEFEAILSDDPRNLPAHLELAQIDLGLRRYLEGARTLQAVLQLDPHNAQAEELLGDLWLSAGDSGRAAAEFHRLLTFAPQDFEAHYGLGTLALRQGEASEAAKEFRAALAANPGSAEAHYRLGLALEAQKQTPQAVREFQAALNCDPQFRQARLELDKLHSPAR